MKIEKVQKRVANLHDKTQCVTHTHKKFKKVHKVIKFSLCLAKNIY